MKIIIGKIGLDGHDVGIRLLAKSLRDVGAEVIYLGKRQTPEDFVAAAIQEDADAIGVGSLTGGLADLTLEMQDGLIKEGLGDIRIVAGGILESEDEAMLQSAGIRFFGPDSSLSDVVNALLGEK
jgi:methylmalonyl-CoA mutase C-terminal domain/subunit